MFCISAAWMAKFKPCYLQDEMVCRANPPEQLRTVTATSPCPPIPSPTTRHTWNFYTLSLALHRNSMYICYLRAACSQAEHELIKVLLQIFQVFLQSLPYAHCTSPWQQPQWRPSADISSRIYSFSCSTVLSHWQGRICLGLCSQSSTDLSTPEQVLLGQSSIFSLSLRIWASCLINDWKGKGLYSGF